MVGGDRWLIDTVRLTSHLRACDLRRAGVLSLARHPAVNAACSSCLPRATRDITVPIGQPTIAAISRYFISSTKNKVTTIRISGGKAWIASSIASRKKLASTSRSGPGAFAGHQQVTCGVGILVKTHQLERRPPQPRAVLVTESIDHNAEQPRPTRTRAVELALAKCDESFDVGVLHKALGVGHAAGERACRSVERGH
jgi:hypothetical protein